jgi:putative NADH-flavin reductase
MKNVLLIGASGFVGSAILNELLERNIKVTAAVRNPDKIKTENENLTKVKADVSEKETAVDLFKGFETIISAYNPGWQNPNIYRDTLKVYPTILEAAKETGVKRLLMVGGAGTLFCAPGLRVVDSGTLPEEILPAVRALGEFFLDILTKEKDIDWVFFSPAGLIEPGKKTGKFRLGKDELIVNDKGESKISVEDYAIAMVDELEKEKHHKERFTIGY